MVLRVYENYIKALKFYLFSYVELIIEECWEVEYEWDLFEYYLVY